jgi:hypothetical protein
VIQVAQERGEGRGRVDILAQAFGLHQHRDLLLRCHATVLVGRGKRLAQARSLSVGFWVMDHLRSFRPGGTIPARAITIMALAVLEQRSRRPAQRIYHTMLQ